MDTRSSTVRLAAALIMVFALVMCAFTPAAASTGSPPVIVIGPGGPPAPAPGSGSVIVVGPGWSPPPPPAPPPANNGSVIVIGPAQPQGNGSGIGVGNWASLTGTITYRFDYVGGDTAAEISVGADPGNGVIFNVYTAQQWQFVMNGDQNVTPIGRGTYNPYAAGNLFWKGQSAQPLTFYVQVIPVTQPVRYWINLTGNGGNTTLSVVPGSAASGSAPVLVGSVVVSQPGVCWNGHARVKCR